jgi:Flp pilus assembly protein TadG
MPGPARLLAAAFPVRERQAGAATVEVAAVIPLLIAVTFAMLALVGIGRDQVLAQGAAREAAREAALSGDAARAVAAATAALPRGQPAKVTVQQAGGNQIRVEVALTAALPFGAHAVTVRAAAVALEEPGPAPTAAGP